MIAAPLDQGGRRRSVAVPEPQDGVSHPMERFFGGLRRARCERTEHARAAGIGPKRRALLTMVRDEPVFLPIWLGYYSRHFAAEDIYVLDHGSSDGSTAGEGFVRIPVSHDTVDHTWMVSTIEDHQHELLERYDVVLVTDVDEIVAPRPELGTLGEYLDWFDEEFVNCLGYELLHLVDREAPFDPSRPVLDQRRYWFANAAYDKPALATEPTRWEPGFHWRKDRQFRLDPDLCLIHLHRMDYEICLARHRYRHARAWNERDVAEGWASHNRISDEADFARWFYEEKTGREALEQALRVLDPEARRRHETMRIVVEPIQAPWRGLF